MDNRKHTVLLLDDEESILNSLCRELRQSDREIVHFSEVDKAIDYLMINHVDLIISDYRMPIMNGVEFLTKVKKIQPDLMSIILSGNSDLDFLKDAINEVGIYRFVSKPWENFELKTTISCALEFKELQAENKKLADEVREKNNHIYKQQKELDRFETIQPGITQVDWDDDGAILINENSVE